MTKKKKIIITAAVVLAAVIGLSAGSIAYGYDVVKKNSIGSENALKAALNDAGVSEENAIITKSKMSFDDGKFVYDIEFLADAMEYDYEIKASDGAIIKKEKDIDKSGRTSQNTTSSQSNQQESTTQEVSQKVEQSTVAQTSAQPQTQDGDISLDEAKNIAFKNAGIKAQDVIVTKAKLDYDDGISVYDIEFYNSSYKFDYEISTKGEIISFDRDNIKNNSSSSTQSVNTKYIGIDKAKSLALSNAGVKSSDATFTKAKLEKDDGVWLYEIEFISGSNEYEYEINALNGNVISHDMDSIYD